MLQAANSPTLRTNFRQSSYQPNVVDGSAFMDQLAQMVLDNSAALAQNGRHAFVHKFQTGVYVDSETITIGDDIIEIVVLETDSTDDAGGLAAANADAFNNTTDPLTVTMTSTDYPVTGQGGTNALEVGELILLGSEILRTTAISGNDVTFERGAFDTTPASHADNVAIEHDAAWTKTNLPLCAADGTAVTAEAIGDALLLLVNSESTQSNTGIGPFRLIETAAAGAAHMLVASAAGTAANGFATTETLSNGSFSAATTGGGVDLGTAQQVAAFSVVPSAAQVTAGNIVLPVSFDPTAAQVRVRVTASGLLKTGTAGADLVVEVIAGGAAGAHTVTGIATTDTLVDVLHFTPHDTAQTFASLFPAEFTISGADTIDNTAGTDTTGDALIVMYRDSSVPSVFEWNGAVTLTAAAGGNPAYVTLTNSGNVDWAATDTVEVIVYG